MTIRTPALFRTHASRYHDFSYGHRVVGHEHKCRWLHGHNGRVHFFCEADALDSVGRVIDFSVIKSLLCNWVEDNLDHKFLAWEHDPTLRELVKYDSDANYLGVVWVPFNPTAEKICEHLLMVVGPKQLQGTGVRLVRVVLEETRKCHASVETAGVDLNFEMAGALEEAWEKGRE